MKHLKLLQVVVNPTWVVVDEDGATDVGLENPIIIKGNEWKLWLNAPFAEIEKVLQDQLDAENETVAGPEGHDAEVLREESPKIPPKAPRRRR